MKVAISGGSGFLGRPLAQKLVELGHEPWVLTRDPARTADSLPKGVRAIAFNAQKPDISALAGVEAIVNLAGESIAQRWTDAHKAKIRDSRVVTTTALVEAARALKTVRAFISASAIGYYGPRDDAPVDEDTPPGSDFLAQVCIAWERAAAEAANVSARVAVVRMGMVLHPDGGALKPLAMQFRLGAGGPAGSGKQWVSWIHRDDAVALLAQVLGNATLSGAFNGTAPNAATNADFAKELAHALHRPSMLKTPGFALKAMLGEMSTLILDGQRVVPKRTVASGFTFAHPELPGALRALFSAPPAP